jgi:hypothetical protein
MVNGQILSLTTINHRLTTTFIVDGTRDLVDWFPVFVDLKSTLDLLNPDDYEFKLCCKSNDNLHVIFTDLKPSDAGNYLTDKGSAEAVVKSSVYEVKPDGVNVPRNFIDGIKGHGKGIILIEAGRSTVQPLQLKAVNKACGQTYVIALPLNVSRVEDMYWRVSLRVNPCTVKEPTNISDETLKNNKNFVFVHGYNVNEQQARGWNSEMFKRMYWSGSLAKFWGVTWWGNDTQRYIPSVGYRTANYQINVIHAFDTAQSLKGFINQNFKGNVVIAAHSLGAMLASEAIYKDAFVDKYFMLDGAVAAEAFDGEARRSLDMVHSEWLPFINEERVFSSEWHELFKEQSIGRSGDFRSKLTWKDKFDSVSSIVYNFYSSGEEVFEPHPFDNNPDMFDSDISNGTYVWTLQEKLKGRMMNLPSELQPMSSECGGWGFNMDEYPQIYGSNERVWNLFLKNLKEILDSDLRSCPLFCKGTGNYDQLFVPRNNTDVDFGSLFAYTHYYELLARFFSARTLAAGITNIKKLSDFGSQRNMDMNVEAVNTLNGWPNERINGKFKSRWLHNDLREVSYLYVYGLFDRCVEIGGLNK